MNRAAQWYIIKSNQTHMDTWPQTYARTRTCACAQHTLKGQLHQLHAILEPVKPHTAQLSSTHVK